MVDIHLISTSNPTETRQKSVKWTRHRTSKTVNLYKNLEDLATSIEFPKVMVGGYVKLTCCLGVAVEKEFTTTALVLVKLSLY